MLQSVHRQSSWIVIFPSRRGLPHAEEPSPQLRAPSMFLELIWQLDPILLVIADSRNLSLRCKMAPRTPHVVAWDTRDASVRALRTSHTWKSSSASQPESSTWFLLCVEKKALWLTLNKNASPVLERLQLEKKQGKKAKAKLRHRLPTFNRTKEDSLFRHGQTTSTSENSN